MNRTAPTATDPGTGSSGVGFATVRRCQPVLGTFVEIEAEGPEARVAAALDHAFAAVRRVQELMSIHDGDSELSRVNAHALHAPVPVHPWTYRVLGAAGRLAIESDGAFDPTAPSAAIRRRRGTWRDLSLLPGFQVSFLREIRVDLGGIAKGFAVDRATEALRRHGMVRGVVNAGGDLRVFGSSAAPVHLRAPVSAGILPGAVPLRIGALATSAPTFQPGRRSRGIARGLVDPGSGRFLNAARSVTVAASTCLWADALTKVVWVLGERAAPILARHHARAWICTPP